MLHNVICTDLKSQVPKFVHLILIVSKYDEIFQIKTFLSLGFYKSNAFTPPSLCVA